MATAIGRAARPAPWAADGFEKGLSVAAMVLLAAVLTALARGHAHWAGVPGMVWAHIATILVALALAPVILLRPRGDARHRMLGQVWSVAMLLTAALSFGIHLSNPGGFSLIHILSVWVLIQVPILWYTARKHQVARHRRSVRGLVTGALLIAGFFTFPFDRLLGHWLFG
ncbi:hypothetical protein M9979_11740 [Sphingomonas sp. RP10(2022)]|uniref:DUF2306 domain-containing protein n=1 Tax=Sphingomonas liriopis TaxID=2949094 RepID=A0A9X2HXT3_9SPHN|nr:hypothetical protein [Sphingomonas liriopis]MCP3735543.1 hypothetical protein [Sphingomonas liriopis]